jgi:hypothetical protein
MLILAERRLSTRCGLSCSRKRTFAGLLCMDQAGDVRVPCGRRVNDAQSAEVKQRSCKRAAQPLSALPGPGGLPNSPC